MDVDRHGRDRRFAAWFSGAGIEGGGVTIVRRRESAAPRVDRLDGVQ